MLLKISDRWLCEQSDDRVMRDSSSQWQPRLGYTLVERALRVAECQRLR